MKVRSVRIESQRLSPYLPEELLHDIFGISTIVQHTQCECVHKTSVSIVQVYKSRLVAPHHSLDRMLGITWR